MKSKKKVKVDPLERDWAKIMDREEKQLTDELKDIRKHFKSTAEYAKALEDYYITAMLNWSMGINELVRLRGLLARGRRKK